MSPLLEVTGLCRHFGGLKAVDNVSLQVAEGEILAVIGPNGAGKTTLFNCICGALAPTRGTVRFLGRPIGGLRPSAITARGLTRTWQNVRLFRNLTVLENVLAGGYVRSLTRSEAEALLERTGLAAMQNLLARELSYGDMKRLELARALAARPRLLCLDEPAAGLTPTETRVLTDMVAALASDGLSVLLIEHDMSMVMRISHRVHVLDQGMTIAEGPPAHVRSDPRVIAAYLGSDAPPAAAQGGDGHAGAPAG